ncbi:MFS transporter [Salinibacterium sp.]|uniref:MFS transporter n=1 Tax=Salinibacterium sp. TaxID=1915057 RepID=UPI00286B8FB2|nr:MFS transporter [Salinibacterium sp.]
MSRTPPPGTALDRRRVLAWRNAIFLVFALPGLAMASWVSRLPAVRDALDVSPGQVGLLIVGISVGSITGLVASSHIVARFGAVTTITWGLVATALGISITGLAVTLGPSFSFAFVGLMVFGAATGITDVAMNVSGAANERALGRSIMPIFHAFFSFGTMVGAAAGALAELAGLPIATHLGVAGALMVVSIFLVRRFIQPEHVIEEDGQIVAADDHSRSWRGRLSMWRDPRTLLIGVLVLAAAFAEGSANDWLAIASVDGHGVNNETGALIFGVFVTAMTIGRLGGVFLLDRFGRVAVLRGSFFLAVMGLLIFIFVPATPLAIVGVVLWGLGSALGFPIGMSAAADDPKTAAARVSAVATIGYFAFLVGPPVIGLLGEYTGVLHALLIVLVLAAIGSLVAGAAREPRPSGATAPLS